MNHTAMDSSCQYDMLQDIGSLLSGQQAGSDGISTSFSVQQVGSDTPILQSSQASPPQNNPKRLFYTAEEIDAMCEEMECAGEMGRLGEFLDTLSPAELSRDSENVAKARCLVAFHRRKYAEVFSLIKMRNFSPHNHKKLQDLWFKSYYAEARLNRPKKKLTGPDRFRIRKKHPLPSTIFDGDETKYGVRESTRAILEAFFEKKRLPSKEEKQALAIETKETLSFIRDWFKNTRNRRKKKNNKNAGNTSQHQSGVAPQPAAAQPSSSMMPRQMQKNTDAGNTRQHQSEMVPQPAAIQPCSSTMMPPTATHGPNPSSAYAPYYGGPSARPPTDYSHLNMGMNSDHQQQGYGAQYPRSASQYYGGADQYNGGVNHYYVDLTPYQGSSAPPPRYQTGIAAQYQSCAHQYQSSSAPQYQTGIATQYQNCAPQYQSSSAPQYQSSSAPQYQSYIAPQYQSCSAPQPSYQQNYNY